jgi:hypothetical protein
MPSRKIDTVRGQVIFRKVGDFIDPISSEWDEALIRDIFQPFGISKGSANSFKPELGGGLRSMA